MTKNNDGAVKSNGTCHITKKRLESITGYDKNVVSLFLKVFCMNENHTPRHINSSEMAVEIKLNLSGENEARVAIIIEGIKNKNNYF